jgi:hypothetical protein
MLSLQYSIILLTFEVGRIWHLSLSAPRAEDHHLDESSISCRRARHVPEPKEEGPLFQSHILVHDTIMFVVPVLARFEQAFHDLPTGMRSRVRAPCRNLSSIHAQLEVVPLRMCRRRFVEAVSNPETRSYIFIS